VAAFMGGMAEQSNGVNAELTLVPATNVVEDYNRFVVGGARCVPESYATAMDPLYGNLQIEKGGKTLFYVGRTSASGGRQALNISHQRRVGM